MKAAVTAATLVALSAGALVAEAAQARSTCSRDIMCVVAEENGNRVDIYVDNKQSAEITVTLDAQTVNLSPSAKLPHTATFPGGRRTKVLSLAVADTAQPFQYRYSFHWTWGALDAEHDDAYVYSLPFQPGRRYRVDQAFHGRFSHFGDFEYAVDFNMPVGTPIYAARDGVVAGVKDDSTEGGAEDRYRNAANYVMIKHADGTVAEYAHLQAGGVRVAVGDKVKAGDFIALSGNSGYTTGPHLHFFVYKAIDGSRRRSFPIRFRTGDAQADVLLEGQTYAAF